MTTVSLRLLTDSDLCLSVEMVENGCAASQEPHEKFLHRSRLRGGEMRSDGTQRVAHCIANVLRRLHGRIGEYQYAEIFGVGFGINPFSSLLHCLFYAL